MGARRKAAWTLAGGGRGCPGVRGVLGFLSENLVVTDKPRFTCSFSQTSDVCNQHRLTVVVLQGQGQSLTPIWHSGGHLSGFRADSPVFRICVQKNCRSFTIWLDDTWIEILQLCSCKGSDKWDPHTTLASSC